MLPAKKQVSPTADANTPAARGFGRVLNSIQGLQQRLGDFSVEDVTHTQNKAENLIRDLSFLQRKLNGLAIIQQTLSDTRRTISKMPEDNFELADLDSLKTYPTLHVLVKANKLIEVVRARAQSFAKYIDDWIATRESAAAITVTTDPRSIKELPSPLLQLEAIPAAEASAVAIRSLVLSETVANEFAPASLDELAPKIERADLLPSLMAEASQSQISGSENSDQDSPTENLAAQTQGAIDKKKNPTAANSGFNQRLLDDLISTYGDFTGAPNLSPPRKKPKPAKPKAAEQKKTTANVALGAANIGPAPRALASVTVLTPESVSTKITQAAIIPLLEVQLPQTAEENVRALTKHSEIDRELKNIIKNYGEYDLYQRHTSPNLKVAGIVAIALLALVLGGFYFFKSPALVTSVPVNSAAQPETKASSSWQESNTMGNSSGGEEPTSRAPNTRQRK